ncbi:MAG TPA: hypothetical protein VE242_11955 [Chthoniobacterales bacterium]|nr:hypothetical protein [Chthoniobacterales bacterium]
MTDRIRELLRARDWRPFTVRRAGGDSIYVRTREDAWVSPYGRLVFERAAGHIEVVAPDQITGVELKSITFNEIESQTG